MSARWESTALGVVMVELNVFTCILESVILTLESSMLLITNESGLQYRLQSNFGKTLCQSLKFLVLFLWLTCSGVPTTCKGQGDHLECPCVLTLLHTTASPLTLGLRATGHFIGGAEAYGQASGKGRMPGRQARRKLRNASHTIQELACDMDASRK